MPRLTVTEIMALVLRGARMVHAPDADDATQTVLVRALESGAIRRSYKPWYWIISGKNEGRNQHKQARSRLREGQFTSNEATHTVLPAPDRRTGTRARMIRVVGAKNFKWLLIYGLWGQRHTPAERVRAMRLRDKLRAALR